MTRKTQVLIAGAGVAVGIYAARKAFGKTINTLPYGYGIKLKKSVTVNSPPERLYRYWRELKNLPGLSDNLLSVDMIDKTRSHWTLRVPGGLSLQWDAEIIVDPKMRWSAGVLSTARISIMPATFGSKKRQADAVPLFALRSSTIRPQEKWARRCRRYWEKSRRV
jgi:hypothetical protein